MKKTALVMTMIAGVSFGGIPIQWDVKVGYDQRFNESSPVAYNITAMRGETLDLMPRYMSSGYPFSIASNADVRIYLREYGTTNAFTVSATSGTVYTTSSQLGRVRAVLLPSDIPATNTNQFFVGVESSGMVYRAYGKLTVLDSPGVIASTNQIQRGVFDSSMFTFSNSHLAPWSLSDIGNYCGVQSVNGLTGVVSITAESLGALTNILPQSYTIITNAPWAHETNTASIMITNGLASTSYVAAAVAAIPAVDAFWPHNATASSWFNFVTNSGAITITGYNSYSGTDVVIPDYINGWPVTEIGANAFEGRGVKSIGGAGNVVTAGGSAFETCDSLTSVSLPHVLTVGSFAFYRCYSLASVSLPQVQTVGNSAFDSCDSLTSVSLPQVKTVDDAAFAFCGGLTSLYFDNDAPTIGADIFAAITPNKVKIYVTNPQATGWGATLGGMPVVRLPLYADAIYQAGELVATTQHVAQAIAAIPVPDMSSRVAVSGGTASNLTVRGWIAMPQSAPTNLVLRLVSSNEHIIVQEVYE